LELAVPLFEESLKMLKSELGTSHPSTLTTMSSLAIGYESMGKIDLAMQLRQEVLILRRAVLGAEHPETLAAMHNVALGYLDAGRHNEALPLFLEAVQGIEKGRFEHAAADLIVPNLLRCLDELQRFDEAEIWRRKWLPVLKQRSEVESPAYASELATWGLSLLQRQRWAEAEAVLTECLAIRQKKRPNIWNTFNTMSLLGGSLLGQKKHTEARELLLQGYEGMKAREKTIPPQGSTRIPEALDRLIQLCEATDKPEEAKKYRELRNEYRERLPMPKEKP
jgi:tetratricopeptide (TPR) repeat protein